MRQVQINEIVLFFLAVLFRSCQISSLTDYQIHLAHKRATSSVTLTLYVLLHYTHDSSEVFLFSVCMAAPYSTGFVQCPFPARVRSILSTNSSSWNVPLIYYFLIISLLATPSKNLSIFNTAKSSSTSSATSVFLLVTSNRNSAPLGLVPIHFESQWKHKIINHHAISH